MQPNSDGNLAEITLRGTRERSAQLQILSKLEAVLVKFLFASFYTALGCICRMASL